jgi:cytochrome c556
MKKLGTVILLLALSAPLPLFASDLVDIRKANFRENVTILKAIRGQIGSEDWKGIADGAQKIANWAEKMPEFFPASAPSRGALPAIWENFDDFKTIAMDNHKAALGLKDAALSKDGDAVMGAVQNLGATCKSCHSSYQAK